MVFPKSELQWYPQRQQCGQLNLTGVSESVSCPHPSMSIGASRISQQIGHSGKSSLVNISSLSNNFKFFDINNSWASKRKFSKWSSDRFYGFYRDFYRLRLDDNRFTVIYEKQADNSLLKVIGNSPFYEIYGRNTLRFAWKTLTNLPQSLTHSSFIDLSLKSSLWRLLRYSVLGTISELRVPNNSWTNMKSDLIATKV